MTLSGFVCHSSTEFTTIKLLLAIKFEVYMSIHYQDMKGDIKCGKWGGLG